MAPRLIAGLLIMPSPKLCMNRFTPPVPFAHIPASRLTAMNVKENRNSICRLLPLQKLQRVYKRFLCHFRTPPEYSIAEATAKSIEAILQ